MPYTSVLEFCKSTKIYETFSSYIGAQLYCFDSLNRKQEIESIQAT